MNFRPKRETTKIRELLRAGELMIRNHTTNSAPSSNYITKTDPTMCHVIPAFLVGRTWHHVSVCLL